MSRKSRIVARAIFLIAACAAGGRSAYAEEPAVLEAYPEYHGFTCRQIDLEIDRLTESARTLEQESGVKTDHDLDAAGLATRAAGFVSGWWTGVAGLGVQDAGRRMQQRAHAPPDDLVLAAYESERQDFLARHDFLTDLRSGKQC